MIILIQVWTLSVEPELQGCYRDLCKITEVWQKAETSVSHMFLILY